VNPLVLVVDDELDVEVRLFLWLTTVGCVRCSAHCGPMSDIVRGRRRANTGQGPGIPRVNTGLSTATVGDIG
jgi:hypothetical protein